MPSRYKDSSSTSDYQSFHSPSEHQHSSDQTGDPLPVEELDGWKAGRQTIFENGCY